MTYYMTEYSASTVGYWERCAATTITGAKREAALRYRGGYVDHEIRVGVGPEDLADGRVEILSRRRLAGGRWADDDYLVSRIAKVAADWR